MAHLWQPTATPIYNITPYRWEVFFQIIPSFRNFPRLQNFRKLRKLRIFPSFPMPPRIKNLL